MKHQTPIPNTVYLSVHNKSSHCHVTDSVEHVRLHKHPICLLVMKMLFSGNAAAVFYMLSCSHAHVIWKDALFITERYHWRIGSFIKNVSPADSLHILTTSQRAAIISSGPCCVWPQWCMAGVHRPSSASRPASPALCWSGIPSAALHSLSPHYLPQRLSKSFFLMTKLGPNIFIYLCWQIFICERVSHRLSLQARGSSQSRGGTGVLN